MNLYKLHTNPESFKHYDHHKEHIPSVIWDTYKHNPDEMKKYEKYFSNDPHLAYKFANVVLHKRFPAGEKAIATDGYLSHMYAKYILNKRFPAGETAIANDPDIDVPYDYAKDVIKGPFLKAEHRFIDNPSMAYTYARYVTHKRFPAGEDVIARYPNYAQEYAKHVIKGPWTHNGKTFNP